MNAFDMYPSSWRTWRDRALEYLPSEASSEFRRSLQFYTMEIKDGARIPGASCEEKEIILLSERILPRKSAEEDEAEVRYLIYIVLHEVAHAFMKHHPPPQEGNDPQDEEADELALTWFNAHAKNPLTDKEIQETKERNKQLINNFYFWRRKL